MRDEAAPLRRSWVGLGKPPGECILSSIGNVLYTLVRSWRVYVAKRDRWDESCWSFSGACQLYCVRDLLACRCDFLKTSTSLLAGMLFWLLVMTFQVDPSSEPDRASDADAAGGVQNLKVHPPPQRFHPASQTLLCALVGQHRVQDG